SASAFGVSWRTSCASAASANERSKKPGPPHGHLASDSWRESSRPNDWGPDLKSRPRGSSMRSGRVRREAVEAKRVLASDELREVGRQRIDELPRSLQSFGVLSEELVAPDDEAVGESPKHREPAGPHAALAHRLCARESGRVNLDAHVQVRVPVE